MAKRKTDLMNTENLDAIEAHLAGTLKPVTAPKEIVQRLRGRIQMPSRSEITLRLTDWRRLLFCLYRTWIFNAPYAMGLTPCTVLHSALCSMPHAFRPYALCSMLYAFRPTDYRQLPTGRPSGPMPCAFHLMPCASNLQPLASDLQRTEGVRLQRREASCLAALDIACKVGQDTLRVKLISRYPRAVRLYEQR